MLVCSRTEPKTITRWLCGIRLLLHGIPLTGDKLITLSRQIVSFWNYSEVFRPVVGRRVSRFANAVFEDRGQSGSTSGYRPS